MNYNDKVMDVIDEVKKVVIGKDVCIAKIMAAIIAGGNILMDDVPGVGKTTWLLIANAMGLQNEESPVYTGCPSGRYNGIYDVRQGDKSVCVQTGCCYVQSVPRR